MEIMKTYCWKTHRNFVLRQCARFHSELIGNIDVCGPQFAPNCENFLVVAAYLSVLQHFRAVALRLDYIEASKRHCLQHGSICTGKPFNSLPTYDNYMYAIPLHHHYMHIYVYWDI